MRGDRFWLACAAVAAGAIARGAGGQERPPAAADSAARYDCRTNLPQADSAGPKFPRDPSGCEFLPSVDDDSAVGVVQRAAMLGTDRARTAAALVWHAAAVHKAAERSKRLADRESAVRFAEVAREYARAVHADASTTHAELMVLVTALHAATAADSVARTRGDCAVALRGVRYAVRAREMMPPSGPGHPALDWRPLFRRATDQVDRLCPPGGAIVAPDW
jgi:hypothetical protein